MQGLRRFQHIAATSSHSARTIAFYRDALGFPLLGRVNWPVGMGRSMDFFDIGNGGILEVFGQYFVPVKPNPWIPDDRQLGIRHVGFKVKDVAATVARLKAAGVEFSAEPADRAGGVRTAFIKDPDGLLLEIVEGDRQYHQPGSAGGQLGGVAAPEDDGLVFDHVAVSVSNLDKFLHFYHDVLGCPILGQIQSGDARGFTVTDVLVGTAIVKLFSFSVPTIPCPWTPDNTILGWRHIGLEYADPDAAAAHCRAQGVPIIFEPKDAAVGGVHAGFVADPDGNAVEITDTTCEYNG